MTKEELGHMLKDLRSKSNYSATEVIEHLHSFGIDISEKTLYSYETGNSSPKISVFFKLCDIYGVDDVGAAFGLDKKEKPTTKNGDGLDERLSIFSTLSPESQKQALDFLDFLAQRESAKDKE